MSFFICSNCGYGSATFIGKCPDCGEWNTLKQSQMGSDKTSRKGEKTASFQTTSFVDVPVVPQGKGRISSGILEFDRVLGGGFVAGQVVLLTGEPGIGKSTLLIQSINDMRALYISGEESASQIKDRAERLKLTLSSCSFSDTLQIEGIRAGIEQMAQKPALLVIDSIQMLYSKLQEGTPGSVSQLRECVLALVRLAKENHIAMILIGHVTKDGDIAGPKMVEHMVDTVLTFEGEKVSQFRILRAVKNRFGSTEEIGIFEMSHTGLTEVNDPLAFVRQEGKDISSVPGRAIAGVMEGMRPLFFEVQTLVTKSSLPIPRRVVHGIDYNKVLLLLAVLKRHMNIQTDTYDVYVNIAGGVDVKSPSCDLAIIASILSSLKDVALPDNSLFMGEVGLLGEVRKVFGTEKVGKEAERIGLKKQFTPKTTRNCRQLLVLFS